MLALPPDVSFESAAMTEPLACALRGVEETGAGIGDTVTVIGAGPLGLLLMRVAKLAGSRVIAVVKREEQAEAARRFGADEVAFAPIAGGSGDERDAGGLGDPTDAVVRMTEGRGSDVVIE